MGLKTRIDRLERALAAQSAAGEYPCPPGACPAHTSLAQWLTDFDYEEFSRQFQELLSGATEGLLPGGQP